MSKIWGSIEMWIIRQSAAYDGELIVETVLNHPDFQEAKVLTGVLGNVDDQVREEECCRQYPDVS